MGDLSNRMRVYEDTAKHRLIKRLPVIIRIDGSAFHTLTRQLKLDKPWDSKFTHAMDITALQLCQNVIQNVRLAYICSDEISFLLNDYATLQTESWFGNKVEKMVSISASTAAAIFNRELFMNLSINSGTHFAAFDSRAFNLPKDEVVNYFISRQQDATRNSIASLAQSYFSHKQLHKLSSSKMQNKLLEEKGVNWNNQPTQVKRGRCAIKVAYHKDQTSDLNVPGPHLPLTQWIIDKDIPIFTEHREYIQNLLTPEWECPMFPKETVDAATKL